VVKVAVVDPLALRALQDQEAQERAEVRDHHLAQPLEVKDLHLPQQADPQSKALECSPVMEEANTMAAAQRLLIPLVAAHLWALRLFSLVSEL